MLGFVMLFLWPTEIRSLDISEMGSQLRQCSVADGAFFRLPSKVEYNCNRDFSSFYHPVNVTVYEPRNEVPHTLASLCFLVSGEPGVLSAVAFAECWLARRSMEWGGRRLGPSKDPGVWLASAEGQTFALLQGRLHSLDGETFMTTGNLDLSHCELRTGECWLGVGTLIWQSSFYKDWCPFTRGLTMKGYRNEVNILVIKFGKHNNHSRAFVLTGTTAETSNGCLPGGVQATFQGPLLDIAQASSYEVSGGFETFNKLHRLECQSAMAMENRALGKLTADSVAAFLGTKSLFGADFVGRLAGDEEAGLGQVLRADELGGSWHKLHTCFSALLSIFASIFVDREAPGQRVLAVQACEDLPPLSPSLALEVSPDAPLCDSLTGGFVPGVCALRDRVPLSRRGQRSFHRTLAALQHYEQVSLDVPVRRASRAPTPTDSKATSPYPAQSFVNNKTKKKSKPKASKKGPSAADALFALYTLSIGVVVMVFCGWSAWRRGRAAAVEEAAREPLRPEYRRPRAAVATVRAPATEPWTPEPLADEALPSQRELSQQSAAPSPASPPPCKVVHYEYRECFVCDENVGGSAAFIHDSQCAPCRKRNPHSVPTFCSPSCRRQHWQHRHSRNKK